MPGSLNADRRGALRDHRSCLFPHVERICDLIRLHFPWAQVHRPMESVASMDIADCAVTSESVGTTPVRIEASLRGDRMSQTMPLLAELEA